MEFKASCIRATALRVLIVLVLAMAGSIPGIAQEPSQKPAPTEAKKEGTIPVTGKSEPRRSSTPDDPTILSHKKAEGLLNQCYQEALGMEPEVKAEALGRIAQSMRKVSKERALYIFQQAFDATSEIQSTSGFRTKTMEQFSIVNMVAQFDLEKALQYALKMDRTYPTGDQPQQPLDARSNALSFVAARIAQKNPDQAFGIVQEQIAQGNYDPSFLAPVALALRKTRPDRAEQLFIEAIHQFQRPDQDIIQVESFVNLTTRLFDLNHVISRQAVDLIVQKVDELGHKQQENMVAFTVTSVGSQGKANFSSIREYAAVQAVAMMRRLDPERAKALEEHFAEFRANLTNNPNGLGLIGNEADSAMAASGSISTNVQTTSSGSGPMRVSQQTVTATTGDSGSPPPIPADGGTQNAVVIVKTTGDGSGPQKLPDPNQLAKQLQSQMQLNNAVRAAANNPQAALNMVSQIDSPSDRAKALARVAAALYKTDPEKSKSLLSDAYTAAGKISDPYDQASIDGFIADGYANFDRQRAVVIYKEAFTLADKAMEDEANAPSSNPFASRIPPEFRRINMLYQQLLTGLSRLNIDEAITRTDQISDKKVKLLTKISIADHILNDGQSPYSSYQIVLK